MITLLRTNSNNIDFVELVKNLDAEMTEIDGDEYSFYSQFNSIVKIKYVVLAYEENKPLGCGAIKEFDDKTIEVKRMYVLPESRGQGIASKILLALENWATELSFTKCVLETGKRLPDAIRLYKRNGYKLIPNYGQYKDVENSVCFTKEIGSV